MGEDLAFAPTTKHIKIDLFPANLYKYSEEGEKALLIENCRLVVTNDYIYAIIMGDTGPVFALVEELVDFEFVPKEGFSIAGAHFDYLGEAVGSCGCGSRLRGMRLLPGVGHINPYKTQK